MSVSWPLLAYALSNVVACGTLGVQGTLALRGHGTRVSLPAAVTVLLTALASGVFAVMRIGRLDRVMNVFGNPSSAIARGYYAIVLAILVAVVVIVALRRAHDNDEEQPLWCAVVAVLASLVGIYALADNLTATVHSAAKTWLTVLYVLIAAVVLGVLVCSAIGAIVTRSSASEGDCGWMGRLGTAGVASGVALGVVTIVYGLVAPGLGVRRAASLTTSTYGIVPGHPSGSSVSDVAALPGAESALFWVGAVVVGVLAPLALVVVMRKRGGASRAAMSAVSVVCVLVGVGITLGLFAFSAAPTKVFL